MYDIDRIISRTLAYSLVTGVHAGLVPLATKILSVRSMAAAATLAAVALFNPPRVRV